MIACLCPANAQIITSIVGGGPTGQQALQVGFATPSGVAVDATGNLFVSVAANEVWKIDTSGRTTVFAGNGHAGSSGDGGPASLASLNRPGKLVFDSAGNLYIADSYSYKVRRVDTSGVITTYAGNGSPGSSGDGGPATAAALNVSGFAFDAAGNFYIADGVSRVRVVSPSGIINTYAGNQYQAFAGEGSNLASVVLYSPSDIAVDSTGAIYIADSFNFRIRKVVNGVITTIAGTGIGGYAGDGGPATQAKIGPIRSLLIDRSNNLYFADAAGVRLIAANQSNVTLYAGNPFVPGYSADGLNPLSSSFSDISALAYDVSHSVAYYADPGNSRVRKVTPTAVTTVAGDGTSGSPANGQLPSTLAVDAAGVPTFSDPYSGVIRKVSLSTGVLSTVAGTGTPGYSADGQSISHPLAATSLTYAPDGTLYFIEGNRVRKIVNGVYATVANSAGTAGFSGDGEPALAAQLSLSAVTGTVLALASNGDLYIADQGNNKIRKIDAQTGIVTTIAGNATSASTADHGSALAATLNAPSSIALDGAGHLFLLDASTIRRITLSTNLIDLIESSLLVVSLDGTNSYLSPVSIFADQSSNLFISLQGSSIYNGNFVYSGSRIVKYDSTNSHFTTVAGTGITGFSGDGGLATAASIDARQLTVDRNQNLYFIDGSGRIRTTRVPACFFTVSAPTIYLNSAGGTGTVTFTATDPSCPYAVSSSSPGVTVTSNTSGFGNGTVTFTVAPNTIQNRTGIVNIGGATVNVQQASLNGPYNVGYFQPAAPAWVLNSTGTGIYNSGDKLFSFAGQPGAIAVTGDWNGDGRTKVGYYLNGFWALDYTGRGVFDGTSKFYAFGGSTVFGLSILMATAYSTRAIPFTLGAVTVPAKSPW